MSLVVFIVFKSFHLLLLLRYVLLIGTKWQVLFIYVNAYLLNKNESLKDSEI